MTQFAQKGRNRLGFTLIELMVVVSVIAIVSAAVVPSFSMYLLRNRQREAAMLIISGVLTARSRAARTGRCHRVRISLFPAPGLSGTPGGVVIVEDAIDANSCSQALNPVTQWARISYRSIAEGADVDGLGADHAGLVGEDVAFTGVFGQGLNTCNVAIVPLDARAPPENVLFEPTGGLYEWDAGERFIPITSFARDGNPSVDIPRYVRILASGAVSFTECR